MQAKKADNIRIGNQVKRAREAAGLTQEKFAERVSLAAKNVSAIERGAAGFSVPTLLRFCDVLGVSSDELLFGGKESVGAGNDASDIAKRLERLSPEQFEIAVAVINKLFEAFATSVK